MDFSLKFLNITQEYNLHKRTLLYFVIYSFFLLQIIWKLSYDYLKKLFLK